METKQRDGVPGEGPRQLHSEHHVQVALLKALRDAVDADGNAAEIQEILDRLADFSRVHFSSEQLLMRLYGYDGYADHAEEHDRAIAKLDELRARLAANDGPAARACLETFSAWLTDHIHHTDSEFARHMRTLA